MEIFVAGPSVDGFTTRKEAIQPARLSSECRFGA